MKLTKLQKGLGIVAVAMLAGAYFADGTLLALFLLLGGIALGAYVIHKMPKRSTKCTGL